MFLSDRLQGTKHLGSVLIPPPRVVCYVSTTVEYFFKLCLIYSTVPLPKLFTIKVVVFFWLHPFAGVATVNKFS